MMKRFGRIVFFPLFFLEIQGGAEPLHLEDALRAVRANNLEVAELDSVVARVDASAAKVDGALDWQLNAQAAYRLDQGADQSRQVDKISAVSGHTGVSKMFKSGTKASFKVEQGYSDLNFPESSGPFSMESLYTHNPEHKSTVALEISQPLWRNFGLRELELTKETIRNEKWQPAFQKKIVGQELQGRVHALYITYAQLLETKKLTEQLVSYSTKFHQLTQKRVALGRSEPLDVAAAKSGIVQAKGSLVRLETSLATIKEQIRFLIFPFGKGREFSVDPVAVAAPLWHAKISDQEEFYKKCLENRQDIAMHRKLLANLDARSQLAEEEAKPELDLFGAVRLQGIESEAGKAFSNALSADNPVMSIGARINVPLGSTARDSDRRAIAADRTRIDAVIRKIQHHLRRDVELGFLDYQNGLKEYVQGTDQVDSLHAEMKLEKERLKQARTEQIAVVRYEMELVRAKIDRLTALYKTEQAQQVLKLLAHSYEM